METLIKKYQIFISSTFIDLADERQDIMRHVLDAGHIPAGMELFPAADVEQLRYIEKIIDQCDYYVLVIAGRYGSIDASGISYTEQEYDYAVANGKHVIAFVHSDLGSIPYGKSEGDETKRKALEAFMAKVSKGRVIQYWSDRNELGRKFLTSLIHAITHHPQAGWVRANQIQSEETRVVEFSSKEIAQKLESYAREVSPTSDLADLDDTYDIRYQAWGSRRGRGRVLISHTLQLTWREIFIAVAAQLDRPYTAAAITNAIKMIAKDRHLAVPSSLNEMDQIQIKVQLVALGLIRADVSRTMAGNNAEFLRLTDLGKTEFLRGMSIRKSPQVDEVTEAIMRDYKDV